MIGRLNGYVVTLIVMLLPVIAIAQEHGEAHGGEHEHGLPTVVYLQAINFLLYAGVLYYFLRKPVRDYFSGREINYNAARNKAAAAQAEAEARKQEIKAKINELQANAASELARAKDEARNLEARILKDAEEISANLRAEASRTATLEIERAKNELREDLLNQSVAFSQKLLKDKMAEGDQKRLQTEFVDKIGASR